MSVDAMAELVDELPEGNIEPTRANSGAVASVDYQPPVFEGLARDALKEVEGQSRSVFIYNVERIDRYRDLLAEALDPMLDALAVDPRDVISREGYIFRAGWGR